MNSQLMLIALALAAGIMIPFQSAVNAQLTKNLASPYYSTLIVFIVASLSIATYILVTRQSVPSTSTFAHIPIHYFLGGVLGAFYILAIVSVAPKIGIGMVTMMVLLGQIIAAMVIDHFGLLHAQVHKMSILRLVGLLLMVGGIYLIKKF